MTELKTLKDFGNKNNWSKGEKLISETELKAEAVKWAKWQRDTYRGENIATGFIKQFFNLTEEDLQ